MLCNAASGARHLEHSVPRASSSFQRFSALSMQRRKPFAVSRT